MVQLRFSNGLYACKFLPYKSPPQEDKFEEIDKAFKYLQVRGFVEFVGLEQLGKCLTLAV
jgi:hypothetical protein